MEITIDLPEEEWAEVVYALSSKICLIEKDMYGDMGHEEKEMWLADLESARDKVAAALTASDVVW